MEKTDTLLQILQKENELQEIVKLIGVDALSAADRMTMETAQSVREDFLQQNAFEGGDSYTALPKAYALIDLVLTFDKKAREAIAAGADVSDIAALSVRERIGRAKSADAEKYEEIFDEIRAEIGAELSALVAKEDTV